MINAIVAYDTNGGIGKDNGLPWPKIYEDLEWFKSNTKGGIVVMGSKTWNSNGMKKPLPGRMNIVVTTKSVLTPMPDHCIRENVVSEIQQLAHDNSDKQVWVIGGANLLKQVESIIDQWYITRIDHDYHCDTFIPKISDNPDFELFSKREMKNIPISLVPRYYHNITFEIWRRT